MYSTWATCGDTGVQHLIGRISGIDPKYDLKQLQYNYFQQISLKYLFCPFGKKLSGKAFKQATRRNFARSNSLNMNI